MSLARKTGEIWGSSYLFSYMMRTLLEQLIDKNVVHKDDIIIPNAAEINEAKQYTYGAGLYPDRLIFPSKPGDQEKLEEAITQTLENMADKIALHLEVKDKGKQSVRDYMKRRFQFYHVEIEVEQDKSPILALSPFLDTMELQEKYIHRDMDNYIARLLADVNGSFLFNDAFGNPPEGIERKYNFDCLAQIGAGELHEEIGKTTFNSIIKKSFKDKNEDDDESIIREFKSKSKDFKTCHKYIAIVQADGDNFGNTIEEMHGDKERLAKFSRDLIFFAREAAKMINDYGGAPIYIGGDDLFFFAPVANKYAKIDDTPVPTIFDLIDVLDKRFKRDFPTVSLSYGMSVTYYKFPLNEAREKAYDLLLNQAKKVPGKNALSFEVLKHSGRTFGATLQKDSAVYQQFKQLLRQYGGEQKYLNSIVNTTEFHKGILNHIGKDKQKVLNFFRNTFDEDIHKANEAFMETAAELFFQVYNENPLTGDGGDNYDTFYSMLRTLHFLNRKDTDND
jgi:CRISPR-associated protein Cmr2